MISYQHFISLVMEHGFTRGAFTFGSHNLAPIPAGTLGLANDYYVHLSLVGTPNPSEPLVPTFLMHPETRPVLNIIPFSDLAAEGYAWRGMTLSNVSAIVLWCTKPMLLFQGSDSSTVRFIEPGESFEIQANRPLHVMVFSQSSDWQYERVFGFTFDQFREQKIIFTCFTQPTPPDIELATFYSPFSVVFDKKYYATSAIYLPKEQPPYQLLSTEPAGDYLPVNAWGELFFTFARQLFSDGLITYFGVPAYPQIFFRADPSKYTINVQYINDGDFVRDRAPHILIGSNLISSYDDPSDFFPLVLQPSEQLTVNYIDPVVDNVFFANAIANDLGSGLVVYGWVDGGPNPRAAKSTDCVATERSLIGLQQYSAKGPITNQAGGL